MYISQQRYERQVHEESIQPVIPETGSKSLESMNRWCCAHGIWQFSINSITLYIIVNIERF